MAQRTLAGMCVDTRAMRLIVTLACAVLLAAGCTSDDSKPNSAEMTFESLDLGLPDALDRLAVDDPPELPDGFNEKRYDRMIDALTRWASASTYQSEVRESDNPARQIGIELPDAIASELADLTASAVSPRLAAANVFADDVSVLGPPQVTTAWKAETVERDGAPALSLKLQTRAAYEVRTGSDGPTRVIGVLRVHELITRTGETGDIGVGFGWQEFGASDCTLALDDALRPDGDISSALDDLKIFAGVATLGTVEMPDLGDEETIDEDYLQRCMRGQV